MTIFKRLSAQKPSGSDPSALNALSTSAEYVSPETGAIKEQMERDLRKKLEPVELDHGYYDDTDSGSKTPPSKN